jgi:asparagine synthase (glutamine-hydrolysing)
VDGSIRLSVPFLSVTSQTPRRDMAGSGRFGLRPSAVCNGQGWWITLETLPHLSPPLLSRHEYRYPYLDRDLVDFLFRVPREQLLRPGRRRSLMRRALKDIVPVEILERRRKAFVARGTIAGCKQARIKSRRCSPIRWLWIMASLNRQPYALVCN